MRGHVCGVDAGDIAFGLEPEVLLIEIDKAFVDFACEDALVAETVQREMKSTKPREEIDEFHSVFRGVIGSWAVCSRMLTLPMVGVETGTPQPGRSERDNASVPRRRQSAETRSRIMAAIRSADTKPALAVRRAAHALGYRFRLHVRCLCPDGRTLCFLLGARSSLCMGVSGICIGAGSGVRERWPKRTGVQSFGETASVPGPTGSNLTALAGPC